MKKYLLGLIFFTSMSVYCFAQQNLADSINSCEIDDQVSVSVVDSNEITENPTFKKFEFEIEVLVRSFWKGRLGFLIWVLKADLRIPQRFANLGKVLTTKQLLTFAESLT